MPTKRLTSDEIAHLTQLRKNADAIRAQFGNGEMRQRAQIGWDGHPHHLERKKQMAEQKQKYRWEIRVGDKIQITELDLVPQHLKSSYVDFFIEHYTAMNITCVAILGDKLSYRDRDSGLVSAFWPIEYFAPAHVDVILEVYKFLGHWDAVEWIQNISKNYPKPPKINK